jgi:hypothetical protein
VRLAPSTEPKVKTITPAILVEISRQVVKVIRNISIVSTVLLIAGYSDERLSKLVRIDVTLNAILHHFEKWLDGDRGSELE